MKKVLLAIVCLCLPLIGQNPYPGAFSFPNDQTTGTTQFRTAKITSGKAIVMANSDTAGYIGVCVSNCGTSGLGWFVNSGIVPLQMDGTSTLDHYVKLSATTGGEGLDSGATTYPASGDVIGRVQTAATGANSFALVILNPEIKGSAAASNLIRVCTLEFGSLSSSAPALAIDDDDLNTCPNSFTSDWTITAVSAIVDQGTVVVRPILTGGSSTSIVSSDVTAATTWTTGTINGSPVVHSFSANGATCSSTPCTIDGLIVSIGSGTPKTLKIQIIGTL